MPVSAFDARALRTASTSVASDVLNTASISVANHDGLASDTGFFSQRCLIDSKQSAVRPPQDEHPENVPGWKR
jgi:hypothetical protein